MPRGGRPSCRGESCRKSTGDAWTEEAPLQGPSHPGLACVEPGLALGTGMFSDILGAFPARLQAYMSQDGVTIAVPIEGTLTIAP